MVFTENIKTPGVNHGAVLDQERLAASFRTESMTELLYGGKENVAARKHVEKLVESEPVLSKEDKHFTSRAETYRRGCAITVKLAELAVKHKFSKEQLSEAYNLVDRRLPIGLHLSMFVPTIEGQGTEEQKKKWLPLCYNLNIIGTYAQTELGHGSFIRGLETTATFDPETDEFVVNSPTLTSMKWWPGNLGKSSNHCIIMAQLIIKGKDYGLHAFIVPLRSREDHMPLPGITIGDIGPKFGYDGNDNGFLIMKNVRIPRDNMLMRYARVDRQGNYSKPPHSKIGYATMVLIRASIVGDSGLNLAKAVTIALRYSAVRRQFFSEANPSKEEIRVIDYQTQQQKLFPLLAQAFMLHFTGVEMRRLYQKNLDMVNKGDLSLMAELHATSSCLKALSSTLSCNGMEIARKALGGHGYSKFCGIIDAWQDWLPTQTYEGENTILYLQTARYLVKSIAGAMAGKNFPKELSVAYLAENKMKWIKEKCSVQSVDDWASIDTILHAFRSRAGNILAYVALHLQKIQSEGLTAMQAFESSSVDLCRASLAHAWFVAMKNFGDAVKSIKDSSLQRPLLHLFILLGTSHIEEAGIELLESGYMSGDQLKMLRQQSRKCLALIRPNCIALADSWDFSDFYLDSALGRYDGNVYEALYKSAQKSTLNSSQVAPGVKEFLLPMMNRVSKM